MVADGRRPQIWVQLDWDSKAQLDRLAEAAGVSVSVLAGMWVRQGMAGTLNPGNGVSPADRVLMDQLTSLAAKLDPELAQRAVRDAHTVPAEG